MRQDFLGGGDRGRRALLERRGHGAGARLLLLRARPALRSAPVPLRGPRPTKFPKHASFQFSSEIAASTAVQLREFPGRPPARPVLARPMNSPCSTTPGMAVNRPARRGASVIRPRWASTIQWPPSVTKTWPSLPFRSTICPELPVCANAPADGALRRGKPERNDLDRQRKAAENIDPFGVVGDHDHAIRGRRHDLFPQQRAAAALDQIERGIDLVGAVDGEIEPVDLVERGQRNAALLGLDAGRLRGRHAHHLQCRRATFSPSRSTKCFAVEPVPSPSFMPSRTCSSARAAACRFNSSIFTRRCPWRCRRIGCVRRAYLASFCGEEQRYQRARHIAPVEPTCTIARRDR